MSERAVAEHYGADDLRARIFDAIPASGLDMESLRPADLAPVDEFHMGGRAATAEIVSRASLTAQERVLDIGSGLGGLVRYLASEVRCQATGVDLTPEYVDIATELTRLTRLTDKADFVVGSALSLPFDEMTFDAALTFHAGMNISDRETLYREAARVLRTGGKLVIYDVLKGTEPGMRFPVPWAETSETSYLVSAEKLREILSDVGFSILEEEDRTPLVLKHHKQKMAEVSDGKPPPPLGLHLLQRANAKEKSQNMIEMAEAGQIALGLFIAQLRE
ncbi:class I SAM-dependent methyltransferase [Mesorhizobium sp.]|uniref:class I SAM-dependent methyltransferase n=1 Tax=Mesorhizobium sp. TaxID=1871066 RepID=UPI000FE36BFB|nr:class I SAM-dependent methyltransferase [Mesorhizobium sp.]RWG83389.1 MAG: class I SAM-dependent methyltransferase [Mesorhizobium sp.]RWK14150.1 MAG: class I SAM-dependent methyltransferase [Mesorhizobium sp.]TIQ44592.1 MAG: methyltransferase domain-containing protein [Mesorhizobium sp.]TIQ56049.1 MAG: methyltransferase domain-containing protein [Mesorhizobium sp.]